MVTIGLAILAMTSGRSHPHVLWNASHSIPIGLYLLVLRTPAKGDLAVVRLPDRVHALAVARGYLAGTVLLIKPVAAGGGDVVCRQGMTVTINGRRAAVARNADVAGRLLPRWSGCFSLSPGQVFVLSTAPNSFDSRYFGPVDRDQILGSGRSLWQAYHHDRPARIVTAA